MLKPGKYIIRDGRTIYVESSGNPVYPLCSIIDGVYYSFTPTGRWIGMKESSVDLMRQVTDDEYTPRHDLRDFFALAALSPIIAQGGLTWEKIADDAYKCADAMLIRREFKAKENEDAE